MESDIQIKSILSNKSKKNKSLLKNSGRVYFDAHIKEKGVFYEKRKPVGGNKGNATKHKIIEFGSIQNSAILTETEINNLFLGFVRLIKKNVVHEKEHEYKSDINYFSNRLAACMIELDKKDNQIKALKQELKNKEAK